MHAVNSIGEPKHKKVRTILSVRAAHLSPIASAVQPRQDSSRVKACFVGSVWSTAFVWPESALVRAAACAALLSLAAAAAAVAEAGDGAVEVRAPKPSRMARCGGIVGLLRAPRRHTPARHSLTPWPVRGYWPPLDISDGNNLVSDQNIAIFWSDKYRDILNLVLVNIKAVLLSPILCYLRYIEGGF